MGLRWNGAGIAAKVTAAAQLGIDKTMADCVTEAKANHPGWVNRTGTLEGSIRIVDEAAPAGAKVVGRWGSEDVRYAIFLELGTSKMEARPYLRPAADKHYPMLRARIQAAFAGRELP